VLRVDAAYCYGCFVAYDCVCVSVGYNREPYKTDEPIEVAIGTWTRVGPRNHVLGGGPDTSREGALLGGYICVHFRLPSTILLDKLNVICKVGWEQRCGLRLPVL